MIKMENSVKTAVSQPNLGIASMHREQLAERLGLLLADEHVLYIKLRNYHWNVKGPFFGPLHTFFETQYNDLAVAFDDIAERVRALGFFADGSMQSFLENARLQETGNLNGDATDMLTHSLADHEMIIQVLRQDVDDAMDQYGDAGTSDFLTGLMEQHEKMAWMVRAHLG